jgi:predicted MPP superfamily phosphohydrolase
MQIDGPTNGDPNADTAVFTKSSRRRLVGRWPCYQIHGTKQIADDACGEDGRALMWFVYVAVGLVLLGVAGLYVRRRLTGALSALGVRERRIRIARWAVLWLLYGVPLIMVGSILVVVALGHESVPRLDGPIGTWLLLFPFTCALLVALQAVPWLLALDVACALVRRRRDVTTANRVRTIGVLVALGVFAVYTPARVLVERGAVRLREHRVAAAPTTANRFRIAFVADIQQDRHSDAEQAREVYAMLDAKQPDVVLSGGDWINVGPDYIEEAAATATELKSRLGTFSVRGDHEHFAYFDRERSVTELEAAMKRHGIAMVSDEVRWFEHAGKRIAVLFINHNYIHRTTSETVGRLIGEARGADYTIAVTHQLDAQLAPLLVDRVDLILGAHTHGGQINPVIGVVHVPLARLETPYTDGMYRSGKTTIIVTAGVGYSIVPFRYASPGSIEIIDLAL